MFDMSSGDARALRSAAKAEASPRRLSLVGRDRLMAIQCSPVQRCVAKTVLQRCVGIGLQQRLHDFSVTIRGCTRSEVQSRAYDNSKRSKPHARANRSAQKLPGDALCRLLGLGWDHARNAEPSCPARSPTWSATSCRSRWKGCGPPVFLRAQGLQRASASQKTRPYVVLFPIACAVCELDCRIIGCSKVVLGVVGVGRLHGVHAKPVRNPVQV